MANIRFDKRPHHFDDGYTEHRCGNERESFLLFQAYRRFVHLTRIYVCVCVCVASLESYLHISTPCYLFPGEKHSAHTRDTQRLIGSLKASPNFKALAKNPFPNVIRSLCLLYVLCFSFFSLAFLGRKKEAVFSAEFYVDVHGTPRHVFKTLARRFATLAKKGILLIMQEKLLPRKKFN